MNNYWKLILITSLFYCNGLNAQIILKPTITYNFFSGSTKTYSSMDELMLNINLAHEASFNECVSSGQRGCAKNIMNSYVNFSSNYINGLPTNYKILYSTFYRNVDIYGNVTTGTNNSGDFYTAQPEHSCFSPAVKKYYGSLENLTVECHLNEPAICPTAGNPISISTGTKVETVIDFQTGDGILNATRKYIGQNSGWENINIPRIYIVEQNTSINTEISKVFKGRRYGLSSDNPFLDSDYYFSVGYIVKNISGSKEIYYSDGGNLDKFFIASDGIFKSSSPERKGMVIVPINIPQDVNIKWKSISQNGDVFFYTNSGLLVKAQYRNSATISYSYDQGRLWKKTDHLGRSIEYGYDDNSNLKFIITPMGNEIRYFYSQLSETIWVISKVLYSNGSEKNYHYEDARFPTALTGITDERGARYATWTYDAQGRAISSEHAGGAEKTLLAFNADGSTTVTNALNKQTIYRFDDIAGARRVTKVEGQPTTNCVGANQDYTYTAEGWIASKTDWKGIKTTFTYNSVGQEISRTEAFGTPEARTTITEWHPTLFVKTKVTEPEKETIYNYDANGCLLNQSTHSITVQ